MNKWLSVLILVIVTAALIVSLVYVTMAASKLTGVDGYKSNADLQSAHSYLTWTAVGMWILLALLIVGIGLLLFFGPEFAFAFHGLIINGLLVLMIAGALTVGILSIIAATKINASGLYGEGNGKTAYTDTIIAASLTIGIVGILFILLIIYFIVNRNHQKQQQEKKEEDQTKSSLEQLALLKALSK